MLVLPGMPSGTPATMITRWPARTKPSRKAIWPARLTMTSNPYRGPGSPRVTPGDYGITQVGDATDTSPYPDPHPAIGITTQSYIANMTRLIGAPEGR